MRLDRSSRIPLTRKILLTLLAVPAAVGLVLWGLGLDFGLLGSLSRAYALAYLIAIAIWLLIRGLRLFLWRVSRRLAFSYFLIGVVPLPILLFLFLVAAYIGSGFYLGHVYRDALDSVANDLRFAAHRDLEQIQRGNIEPIEHPIPIAFAYYSDGHKLAGNPDAPEQWQAWWQAESPDSLTSDLDGLPIVANIDGSPTLAAMVHDDTYSILATYSGDLDRELSERSGIWVELFRADDPSHDQSHRITIQNREYPMTPPHFETAREDLAEFFHPDLDDPGFIDRPWLTWVEISEPFLDLNSGNPSAKYISATLTANLRALYHHLVWRTSEVNLYIYVTFITVAFLLLDIQVVAALMALLMVFGLSRAVNTLSKATEKVQQGDFSTRIEVRRQDQIGALQTNFNQMAANLESFVASAAQKEILEKEISIARELQHSLLPDTLAAPPGLRFAAHFEPSTTIGGDYYDLLPMAENRLGVVVADVSGHGLSAGLRMAMVKSALMLLWEEEDRPIAILQRLHVLLRDRLQSKQGRGFVTATLSVIDSQSGELTITNAGHPPTYLRRGGVVSEIMLPSTPLGALGSDFGQTTLQLEAGDVVVWLSDGMIEATDPAGNDFGYDRLIEVLGEAPVEPAKTRDHLLAAIHAHTEGGIPEDDRTLLVMAYEPLGAVPAASEPDEAAPDEDEPDEAAPDEDAPQDEPSRPRSA